MKRQLENYQILKPGSDLGKKEIFFQRMTLDRVFLLHSRL